MYQISYDSSERILHLELEGFWSATTLALFTAELLLRTTPLKMRRISYAVLSDSTKFPVQSSLVAQGLGRIMAKGAETHLGPTAIVVSSHLNKMQAERAMKGNRLQVFLNKTDTRAWLSAEQASS